MLAFHGIVTAYGFWLPNDPRGSWSKWVGSWELFLAGGTPIQAGTTLSVAGKKHDYQSRMRTKNSLLRRPVSFSGVQTRAIARGFANSIRKSHYTVLACSILPEHVHLVIGQHKNSPGSILGHFKRGATLQLVEEGLHPFSGSQGGNCKPLDSCWARRSWKVFLDKEGDVLRAIRYVEQNPIKEGKRKQEWSFVCPYDC